VKNRTFQSVPNEKDEGVEQQSDQASSQVYFSFLKTMTARYL